MTAGRRVDGFHVSPAALSGAAGVVDAEAARIDELITTLTHQLDRLGPCWGSDRVATRFGTAYQDAGFAVLDDLGGLAVGAARIAGALRAVGASYESVDEVLHAALGATDPTPDP